MASLVCSWIKLVDAPYAPPGMGTGAGTSGAFDAVPAAHHAAPGLQDGMKPDEITLLQVGRARLEQGAVACEPRNHAQAALARGRRHASMCAAQGAVFMSTRFPRLIRSSPRTALTLNRYWQSFAAAVPRGCTT